MLQKVWLYLLPVMMIETKQRIIEAAIQVFNEDFSAPLQKVADNAEVTRRTLHRYFKDRDELVALCERDMEISCKRAMIVAISSSGDSLTQLKNMLYAGIDCGAKYSFFYKLHQREGHNHTKQNQDCADYDYIYWNFTQIIIDLQKKGIVTKSMTTEWIQMLHSGIIASTVNAPEGANSSTLKKFAWKSFINGISAL